MDFLANELIVPVVLKAEIMTKIDFQQQTFRKSKLSDKLMSKERQILAFDFRMYCPFQKSIGFLIFKKG